MPAKKNAVTHGGRKPGRFPVWVLAAFLSIVLVKHITPHLFQASVFFSFPSNYTFTLSLEYDDLAGRGGTRL